MILLFTGFAALVPILVLVVDNRNLRPLSRIALVAQLGLFTLIFVSWLGISF